MKSLKISKKIILITILVELFGLAIFLFDRWQQENFDGVVQRPKKGSGDSISTYIAESEHGESSVEVRVSALIPTKEESKRYLKEAKNEIDESFLGENVSFDEITKDVVMMDSYADGTVKASWKLDSYAVMNSEGQIRYENLDEDKVVTAFCELSVGEESYTYTFPFVVKKPDARSKMGFEYYLKDELEKADSKTPDKETVTLPSEVSGIGLSWKPKDSYRGIETMALGLVVGVALVARKKEEEINSKKKRKQQLLRDYPDIVSNLSLYVGAGFSVKRAFIKIADNYRYQKARSPDVIRPGFEEIVILNHEMEDGKGELEAYKQFGKRVGQKEYRKLSLLLTQNLRKGTGGLVDLLEKEEREAFEHRKTRAKILAEEASTKLLIPMFGLLAIILVILIFPAMQGFNI